MSFKQTLQAVNTIENAILEVAKKAKLDIDKTKSRIQMAKSANGKLYGKIPALINLLASTVIFPAYSEEEYSLIADRKKKISRINNKILHMDSEFETALEYIKDTRGSTAFLDQKDTLDIIHGTEPDADMYKEVVNYIAEHMDIKLSVIDHRITQAKWQEQNIRAEKKAKKLQKDIIEELDKFEV